MPPALNFSQTTAPQSNAFRLDQCFLLAISGIGVRAPAWTRALGARSRTGWESLLDMLRVWASKRNFDTLLNIRDSERPPVLIAEHCSISEVLLYGPPEFPSPKKKLLIGHHEALHNVLGATATNLREGNHQWQLLGATMVRVASRLGVSCPALLVGKTCSQTLDCTTPPRILLLVVGAPLDLMQAELYDQRGAVVTEHHLLGQVAMARRGELYDMSRRLMWMTRSLNGDDVKDVNLHRSGCAPYLCTHPPRDSTEEAALAAVIRGALARGAFDAFALQNEISSGRGAVEAEGTPRVGAVALREFALAASTVADVSLETLFCSRDMAHVFLEQDPSLSELQMNVAEHLRTREHAVATVSELASLVLCIGASQSSIPRPVQEDQCTYPTQAVDETVARMQSQNWTHCGESPERITPMLLTDVCSSRLDVSAKAIYGLLEKAYRTFYRSGTTILIKESCLCRVPLPPSGMRCPFRPTLERRWPTERVVCWKAFAALLETLTVGIPPDPQDWLPFAAREGADDVERATGALQKASGARAMLVLRLVDAKGNVNMDFSDDEEGDLPTYIRDWQREASTNPDRIPEMQIPAGNELNPSEELRGVVSAVEGATRLDLRAERYWGPCAESTASLLADTNDVVRLYRDPWCLTFLAVPDADEPLAREWWIPIPPPLVMVSGSKKVTLLDGSTALAGAWHRLAERAQDPSTRKSRNAETQTDDLPEPTLPERDVDTPPSEPQPPNTNATERLLQTLRRAMEATSYTGPAAKRPCS